MSVQLVNYYHLKEGRNVGVVVAFGSWPERVLKHRGWTRERRIHLRVATEREHEIIRESMRYQAWLYRTRSALLEDEAENLDEDGFKRLCESLDLAGFHEALASGEVQ